MKQIRLSKGFSLIELMIAMAAGLLVIGAVIEFTISTARSTSVNIRSTRIMQDLRNSMNLIEREIRRSGFDENAYKFAGTCVSPTGVCPVSNFNSLVVDSPSCIVVSYDNAASATPGTLAAGEFHGFRRVANAAGAGVIQASLAGAARPNCTDAATSANWLDVTNPDSVNVTNLNFTQPATAGGCVSSAAGLWIVVQDVLVQMTGQGVALDSGAVTTRSIEESVRVKNDRISVTKPSVCP